MVPVRRCAIESKRRRRACCVTHDIPMCTVDVPASPPVSPRKLIIQCASQLGVERLLSFIEDMFSRSSDLFAINLFQNQNIKNNNNNNSHEKEECVKLSRFCPSHHSASSLSLEDGGAAPSPPSPRWRFAAGASPLASLCTFLSAFSASLEIFFDFFSTSAAVA